jgi:hypothetical protein
MAFTSNDITIISIENGSLAKRQKPGIILKLHRETPSNAKSYYVKLGGRDLQCL